MADPNDFAHMPPMQRFAYSWGVPDQYRGTPLEEMPEGGAPNSGFVGTLQKIRPQLDADRNMTAVNPGGLDQGPLLRLRGTYPGQRREQDI